MPLDSLNLIDDVEQIAPVVAQAGGTSGVVLLTLLGVPGPVDVGSVAVTITQGASIVTLTAASGTLAAAAGDGTYTLTAPLPYPFPAGLTTGMAETLVWSDTVGGASQSFAQQGILLSPGGSPSLLTAGADGSYCVWQGDTFRGLPFFLSSELLAGLTSAALHLAPLVTGSPFLADPSPAMQGRTLSLDGLSAAQPYVRLDFSPGWGLTDLQAGCWLAWATLTYASTTASPGGFQQTSPLYPDPTLSLSRLTTDTALLRVQSAQAAQVIGPAGGGSAGSVSIPLVRITASTAMTMPAQDTRYPVTIMANALVILPPSTGNGRKLYFTFDSLAGFSCTLLLNGADAYRTPLPPIVTGATFGLVSTASGFWSIE